MNNYRQKSSELPPSKLHKRMRIVNPASIAVERLNYLFRQNGFYPIFSPSLETAAGINNKKIQFDREDIQNVDNSNYPLLLYNRTPLIKSQRISGERVFTNIVGPVNSLVNYTHGEFTLRTAAVFNSMEQLEEFETSYLLCGINAESLHIYATLPPVGVLETLSDEDRRFILDLYWADFSDLQVERNNGRYEFAVGNNLTVLTQYFDIADPETITALKSYQLNFFWDEEFEKKESEWNFNDDEQPSVTYVTDSSGPKTVYPYINDIDPEYEETDFVKTDIQLIGYEPDDIKKKTLDPDHIKYGSSLSEVIYSFELNSEKYQRGGVTLLDIQGSLHEDISNPFSIKYGREYYHITKKFSYSLSVNDRYEQKPSSIKIDFPIMYPIAFGVVESTDGLVKQIATQLQSKDTHWTDTKTLHYGGTFDGYFYYAYPSLYGRLDSPFLIPSENKFDLRLLTISNFALKSGKCLSKILIEYFIYVSREKITDSIAFLLE